MDISQDTVAITGAFGYTGKYTTRILLERGYRIRTLTNHPHRSNPFGDTVQVFPMDFDHPDHLCNTLQGAATLILTRCVSLMVPLHSRQPFRILVP